MLLTVMAVKDLVLEGARMLTSLGQALGLLSGPLETTEAGDAMTEQLMELLIELRAESREQKNFALSDAIRDKLKSEKTNSKLKM